MIIAKIRSLHDKLCQGENYKWWCLVVIQFGIFFVGINATIVNLALPSISKAFHASISLAQLLIIVYSAAIAVFLPITGQLPHFFGRKKIVIGGFLLFTLFSAGCALANSLEMLITLQVFLAIGGAALLANSNSITQAVFPLHQHGLAMGINGTVASIGYGAGLLLGGYLIGNYGWRSIYWLNFPFGLFAIFLGLFVLAEKKISGSKENAIKQKPSQKLSFDYWGALFFALTMGGFIFALKERLDNVFFIALIVVCFGLFIFIEARSRFPLIDLRLFKNENFTIGSATRLLITIVSSACLFLIPFYTQMNLALTPLNSGLAIAPFSLALFFAGPLGGKLSDQWGSVKITCVGFLSCLLGLLILSVLSNQSTLEMNVIKVGTGMFFIGWGLGFFVPSNNKTTLNAVPSSQVGVVSGFLWSMAYLGTVMGTALSAILIFQQNGSAMMITPTAPLAPQPLQNLLEAQKTVFLISLGVCVLGFVLCLLRPFMKKL